MVAQLWLRRYDGIEDLLTAWIREAGTQCHRVSSKSCLSVIVGYILRYGDMVSRVDENVSNGPTRDVRRGLSGAKVPKLTSVDHDWLQSRPNINGYPNTAKPNVRRYLLIPTIVLRGLHRLLRL